MNLPGYVLWVLILAAASAGSLSITIGVRRASRRQRDRATEQFRQRREWLEAEFVLMAAETRRPHGFAWADPAERRYLHDLADLLGLDRTFAHKIETEVA